MIKAAIFDLDMTLVDSLETAKKVIKDMEEKEGISYSRFLISEIAGMPNKEFMRKLSEANGNKLSPKKISRRSKSYMRKHYSNSRLEGIGFLKELQSIKIGIGIISHNSRSVIETVLENEYNKGINFDCIYGCDNLLGDGSKSKTIKECLRKFNVQPIEIYVGDHINDIIAAKDAKVMSAGITSGLHTRDELIKYKPDILVDTIEELRDYLFDNNMLYKA